MINRPQRYSRTDPWQRVPFEQDDEPPTMGEAFAWFVMGAVILGLLAYCLGLEF